MKTYRKHITLIALLFIFSLLFQSKVYTQWDVISTINTTSLNCVKFFDSNTGLTCGAGGIWKSTNSGVNWTNVQTASNLYSISFPVSNTGYCVGDSGAVYKTTNNGINWVFIGSPTVNNLYGTSFTTENIGYAVGQNGIILRTQNGGSTWNSQFNPIPEALYAIYMKNASTAFGVGSTNAERYISTGNSGMNWIYTINVGGNSLKALALFNTYKLEVVGTNGLIRYSTNAGGQWSLINSGTSAQLNSIVFPDTSNGYIAGNSGIILRSTNSGLNWQQQTSSTSYNLKSITFINTTSGWAVGQNGIVIRTGIPVSIMPITGKVPEQFRIYQNYPNPFNSTSKIIFELPRIGNISIDLISVEGKILDNLLDNLLTPGKYCIILNANNYSSGIYFIKAIYNKNIFSIKLMLIK
ncbi:MAG: T9SS C-terminal target domain-containing protein [Ignavibacteriae bacterium]|nr:MAG: T9SS C-terminal target domain-containing protein [Ignavibacteriota bacterium]